jgi:hypothetical protein
LHWWRAIKDDGLLENGSEQESKLREAGYQVEPANDGKRSTLISLEAVLMSWEAEAAAVEAAPAAAE